jgi:hypothetical protein
LSLENFLLYLGARCRNICNDSFISSRIAYYQSPKCNWLILEELVIVLNTLYPFVTCLSLDQSLFDPERSLYYLPNEAVGAINPPTSDSTTEWGQIIMGIQPDSLYYLTIDCPKG